MFAPAYERRFWDKDERKVELVFHPLFAEFMKQGKDTAHFVGARDLTVRDHMEVQRIVQRHTDNAVSKTINTPEDYSLEDMSNIWMEFLPDLKGTTFYRENTRGYVNDQGIIEPPPLTALSLDEATARYSEAHKMEAAVVDDCPSGVCSI